MLMVSTYPLLTTDLGSLPVWVGFSSMMFPVTITLLVAQRLPVVKLPDVILAVIARFADEVMLPVVVKLPVYRLAEVMLPVVVKLPV